MHAAASQDYVYRFEPLVLEECGALMLRGNEEGIQSEPFQAVCASHKLVCPNQRGTVILHAECSSWIISKIASPGPMLSHHCYAQQAWLVIFGIYRPYGAL